MRIWKKALSAGLTAMLLASLTASAAFAAIDPAASGSDQTDALNCTAAAVIPVASVGSCSQVADGISTVTLSGDGDLVTTGRSLYISASGASMIASVGDFVLVGGIVSTGAAPTLTGADTITLRAPAAVGTATVSVYTISVSTGIATLEGTMTINFTATSGLAVSEANSLVKFVATAAQCDAAAITTNAADKAVNPAAKLCVNLKDGNGTAITSGATVAVTITPVGLVVPAASTAVAAGAGTSQATSSSANLFAGSYAFGIGGSNLAGTATIGISVTQGTTTTTFAPKTFTFSGALATLTVTQVKYAVVRGSAVGAAYQIATVVGKDAAGNVVACDTLWTATSGTTSVIANANLDVVPATDCDVQIIGAPTPATAGTTAITVKNAAGTIAAAPFNFSVSGDVATVTVAFSAASIVPGGSATLTMTAKDSGGRPVPDAATPGTPLVSSGAATAWSTIRNGIATATYLAPFNTGVVTALGSVTTALPVGATVTATGSTNIGAVVPAVTSGTNASALGVTTAGPFSTTTKVAALGKYQTFKISFGAGAAGTTVGILVATKNSAGVWSSFTRLTGRVADSAGNVYYYWRSSAASWISLRGDAGGTLSNAVQGRWR